MSQHTILHTIETGGPGGAETVVFNLASRLDPSRFRSLVLLSQDDWLKKKLDDQGIPTYLVPWTAWHDLRPPRTMARLIREQKVDLIHSHLPGQNFYSCLVGRLTGRKTIVTYHGPIELSDAQGMRGGLKLWFVRREAAAVVVICDYVGRMLNKIGFEASKILRIYNGINAQRFRGNQSGRLRQELGLRNGTKLVGMVANVRQTKGYEFFIRAAREVTATLPDTRFLAVGDFDPTLGAPLLKLVEELSLGSRFRFLGFREDVPEILSDLDVFVLSSTSEGFPLVTLEAMAAGKPVVATRCGGPEEVIEDGRTGFLVPPGDPGSLARKISELLQNPDRAAAVAQAGRAKVEGEFSVERMLKDYEDLYRRVLAST